jgi:hypothetical protein
LLPELLGQQLAAPEAVGQLPELWSYDETVGLDLAVVRQPGRLPLLQVGEQLAQELPPCF